MKTEVIKILNNPDRNKHLPIDIELKAKLSDIQSLQNMMYSHAKTFLKDYKPDEKMNTIKPDDDSKSRDEEKKEFELTILKYINSIIKCGKIIIGRDTRIS